MTWKLEKATVGLANLVGVVVVASGLVASWVSLSKDQESTDKRVEKVEAVMEETVIPDVAGLKTGQAVMVERMTTLEESVRELKDENKHGIERILEKLNER